MRVWNLDSDMDDDSSDIRIFIPGPPGPPLVDVGSLLSPVVVSTVVTAPSFRRQRSFIKANSDILQPILSNPPDNGPWELYLYVTGSHTVTFENASNIKLSGQWIGSPDSIIYLQWDGNSRYVEGGRNEI